MHAHAHTRRLPRPVYNSELPLDMSKLQSTRKSKGEAKRVLFEVLDKLTIFLKGTLSFSN